MALIDEAATFQVARHWIAQHGSQAEMLAIKKAKRCLARDDAQGAVSWIAVALAIEDLANLQAVGEAPTEAQLAARLALETLPTRANLERYEVLLRKDIDES